MGPEMEKYTECEDKLPFDTHYLKAMIAPRTLFVSEAAGDIWSNPVGSYMTTIASGEVFDFLGVPDNVYWYFRPGFPRKTTSQEIPDGLRKNIVSYSQP